VPLTDIGNTPGIISDFSIYPLQYVYYFSRTHPYVIGATVEFRLPRALAIEVDALYRHLNYTYGCYNCELPGIVIEQFTPAGVWEFPTMLKYRFPTRTVRPFLTTGFSWEFLNAGAGHSVGIPPPNITPGLYAGFVAGAGIDFRVPFLHLSPEIRYTRWSGDDLLTAGGCSTPVVCTALPVNRAQAEFLLGITFHQSR
jgi:hypothetical protein